MGVGDTVGTNGGETVGEAVLVGIGARVSVGGTMVAMAGAGGVNLNAGTALFINR